MFRNNIMDHLPSAAFDNEPKTAAKLGHNEIYGLTCPANFESCGTNCKIKIMFPYYDWCSYIAMSHINAF